MTRIEQLVQTVHRKQQRQWFWRCVSMGGLIFGVIAFAVALLRIPFGEQISWACVGAILLEGPVLGGLYAIVNRRPIEEAASALDRANGLKDRVQTAFGFLRYEEKNELQRLQIEDAEKHLSSIDPKGALSRLQVRSLPAAIGFAVAAILIVVVTIPAPPAIASVELNPAVHSIAAQLDNDLAELRDFQAEHASEELKELLKDLELQIEALKAPGMDPKDALAKLSEMEASLQEMQKNVAEPTTEKQLKEIGEALSLSNEMAAAGQAMAEGKMDKAAEELAKLEMPKLDMKTEKAITEKLNAAANDDGKGSQGKKQKLGEKIEQLSQGLSQGDRSKFKDGVEGLAGECKKQGTKKKLSDLLRKQCQCLGECKSECEGQCKSDADSNKKGGKKAGLARSGNNPGDPTAKLNANPKMNITGQDSGQGDVDVETEQGPEEEQQATRAYREKATEYEAMSESVLNSESIPLGQRQTIRRYFESIRPTNETE